MSQAPARVLVMIIIAIAAVRAASCTVLGVSSVRADTDVDRYAAQAMVTKIAAGESAP